MKKMAGKSKRNRETGDILEINAIINKAVHIVPVISNALNLDCFKSDVSSLIITDFIPFRNRKVVPAHENHLLSL